MEMLQSVLNQITDSHAWSHLLLYVPNIFSLNYFVSPLIAGVYDFLRREYSLSKSEYCDNEEISR